MPQKPKISWRPSQKEKLTKAVTSYNAKINRAMKAHPELVEYLPEKIKAKDLKAMIATRQDLNREVKSLMRLNQGGLIPKINDQGVRSTVYELKELQYKVNRINRIRKRELQEMNPSTEKGTMGNIKTLNLKPKKFNFKTASKTSWRKLVESIEKQASGIYQYEKAEKYKENYLKAINDVLGAEGVELKQLIESFSPEHIFKNFGNDPVLHIDFIYDPLHIAQIASVAYDHWLSTLV